MVEQAWSAARLERDAAGVARLVRDGRLLAEIRVGDLDPAAAAALLDRIEAAIRPRPTPRVVVVYREGLLAEVRAEVPLDLLFVEEDPHDTPPLLLRRRQVAADRDGTAAIAGDAERRFKQAGAGKTGPLS